MEWISRADSQEGNVSPDELKVCELCGTLNHEKNRECLTCGWRGAFGYDAGMINLAWQCLEHQHEGVLMEHVTARRIGVVGDFGRPRQTSGWQRLQSQCRHWWKSLFGSRRHRTTHRHGAEKAGHPAE